MTKLNLRRLLAAFSIACAVFTVVLSTVHLAHSRIDGHHDASCQECLIRQALASALTPQSPIITPVLISEWIVDYFIERLWAPTISAVNVVARGPPAA